MHPVLRAWGGIMFGCAVRWAALMLVGGGLGIGTAEAMQAGWVSERTVLIVYGTLMAVGAAFMLWAARDIDFSLWDDPYDWDDDPPASPDA